MTRFLYAALALAAVSVVAAVVVLSLLLVDPFNLGPNASAAERTSAVSAVTGLSSAISTVIALTIGAIAVTALIVSEQAETRAIESLKTDFASLASTLVSIRDRSVLFTAPGRINFELDVFEPERESLTKFLTGPSGWAIQAWSHERGNERFEDLRPSLAGLSDLMMLDLKRDTAAVLQALGERSVDVFDQICSIEEDDFKHMSKALSHLSDGVSRACATLKEDRIAMLLRDMKADRAATVAAPTEEELALLIQRADASIGGEAGKTIEHFGRAAIDGSDEDRDRFRELIRQLGLAETDDAPGAAGG